MINTDQPNRQSDLPEPWFWLNKEFETELQRELPAGHILFGKSVSTLARRQDTDDFLFSVGDVEFQYAIVHLTWKVETDPAWPRTRIYRTWQEVFEQQILPDSLEFQ